MTRDRRERRGMSEGHPRRCERCRRIFKVLILSYRVYIAEEVRCSPIGWQFDRGSSLDDLVEIALQFVTILKETKQCAWREALTPFWILDT